MARHPAERINVTSTEQSELDKYVDIRVADKYTLTPLHNAHYRIYPSSKGSTLIIKIKGSLADPATVKILFEGAMNVQIKSDDQTFIMIGGSQYRDFKRKVNQDLTFSMFTGRMAPSWFGGFV